MLHDFSSMDAACIRAFGRDVLFLPEAGGQSSVRGIFQRTVEAEDASPGVYAVLFVRSSDLPAAPQRGDEVEVSGARYKVWDVDADPEGGALLRLRQK
jgi:hypothetical protein